MHSTMVLQGGLKTFCEASASLFHIELPSEKAKKITLSCRWHIDATGLAFGVLEKVHGQLWP